MRRLIAILIVFILLPKMTYAAVYEDNGVLLQLNRSYIVYSSQEMPYIDRNNRVLLPLRMIGELMGAKVNWDGDRKKAIITFDNKKAEVMIGSKEAWINGHRHMMDTSAVEKNGTTMVPVRFIADMLDIPVSYDQKYKIVSIQDKRFLSAKSLEQIDEMLNLDESFKGRIIPTKVRLVEEKNSDDKHMVIELMNDSDQVIKNSQLHKNIYFYRSETSSGAAGSRGFIAPSGMTGYNSIDILPGERFTDKTFMLDFIKDFQGVYKYYIVNYFKTTHGDN